MLIFAIILVEALKNDDADDEEGDAEEGQQSEARMAEIEKKTAASAAKQNAVEKRPTGKVVGIVKRNWRACVLFAYSSLQIFSLLIMALFFPAAMFATWMQARCPTRMRRR